MDFERISPKGILLWELLAAVLFALLFAVPLLILRPGTWLWYLILWLLGAAYVLFSFLYLPLYYLSMEYGVGDRAIVYRKGVIFPNTQVLYRDRIAFVTVYQNPLTPLLHISTLVVSAAGGRIRILFLNSERADQIAALLSREDTLLSQGAVSRQDG